jgi:hypothetical protein
MPYARHFFKFDDIRYTCGMKTYTGSCHCGAVTYEAKADIQSVMECNCSYCGRRGFLLAFVPREDFTLKSGEENLTEYRFNSGRIQHLFCKTCGVQGFGYGEGRDGAKMAMLNVRCFDGVDIPSLTVTPVNGRDL